MLFQRFDRLLFLAKGGRTVYFGEIGKNSNILRAYFERNGARELQASENPAEWMLSIIGAAPGSVTDIDWHATWRASLEYEKLKADLADLNGVSTTALNPLVATDRASTNEFAAPLATQIREVTLRVFQQYWRTPSYIYSKAALCILSVSNPSPTLLTAVNPPPGYVHRILLLSRPKHPARPAKPNLLALHALHPLRPDGTTNNAAVCVTAVALRSARTALKNLFLESFHAVQHSC